MKVIIATGDRNSDLYYWQRQKEKNPAVRIFDALNDREFASFQSLLTGISLFQEHPALALHNATLSDALLASIESYEGDIFIVTLQEKYDLNKLPKSISTQQTKVSETVLKERISGALHSAGLTLDRISLAKLYDHVSVDDVFGKKQLVPSLVEIFIRRLEALRAAYGQDTEPLLKELVTMTKETVSQWDLVKKLFSSDKQSQYRYFSKLLQQSNLFEILGIAKTTLFLLLTILKEKENHLDTTSIASKTKKNVYYIESLARTAQENNVTAAKVLSLITRLMNLELAVKSGKFDDEQFAFEVLLATI
jgi:hypothetical protein